MNPRSNPKCLVVNVRATSELIDRVDAIARRELRSRSAQIVHALREYVRADSAEQPKDSPKK